MLDWLKGLEQSDPDARKREARHFAEPHISAAQYSRSRRLALGAEVLGKTRIYLDQRYWIYCRDAMMGCPQKPIHADIWSNLKALAEGNRAVCPVTCPILLETLKQGDPEKRRHTAKAIDALSQGVAIQSRDDLIRTELYHLLISLQKGSSAVHPLNRMGWTYAGWVLGEAVPHCAAFDEATNNGIQKCMFDTLSAVPFSILVESLSNADTASLGDDEAFYAKLNADTDEHQHQVTSFDAVFASEVAGVLDTMRPAINDLLRHHCTTTCNQPAPTADSAEALKVEQWGVNFIYLAYKQKRLTTQFPALHIYAGIHAAIRSRTQPHKKGDLWDHLHAHAALGYCSAFFTEKNLGNLLSSPPLNYAAAYGCHVLWNDDDVLSYLRSLSPSSAPG